MPIKKTSAQRWQVTRTICTLVTGVCLLVAALTARPDQSASALSVPGVTNLDVVLVIDQSGSMWERNDPPIAANGVVKNPGWRIVAANLLAEWLATDQTGAHHQLSVIMFGTHATTIFPLQEIASEQSQAAVQKAITEHNQNMGATDILAALQLAKAELDKGRTGPNTRKAIIFLSDGMCEPGTNATAADGRKCEQDIRHLIQSEFTSGNVPIFTIALTSDAFKQDTLHSVYKNLWQEISVTTGGDYYEPVQAERELLASFVKILQRLFGLPIQAPPAPIDAPNESVFDLPAGLLQAGFTTIKYEPTITMTVIRPDGSPIIAGEPSVQHSKSALTENYTIARPPSGTWRVKVGGQGKVVLIASAFARPQPTIDRLSPAGAHPLGKPMLIQVRVLDANRIEQTPQTFTLNAILPDGSLAPLPLTTSGATYSAVLQDTHLPGAYSLQFGGKLDDQVINVQQSVMVVTAPWLQVIKPQPGVENPANVPVPVQTLLMLGAMPWTQQAPGDRVEVVARVSGSNGQPIDAQFLRPMSGGLYSGTITADAEGTYTANLQLSYTPATGEGFVDNAQTPFTVKGVLISAATPPVPLPTPVQTPVPERGGLLSQLDFSPELALLALGILGCVALLLLVTAMRQVKVLSGMRNDVQQTATRDFMYRTLRAREVGALLRAPDGWQLVTEQIVADALHCNISINGNAGILDVSTVPAPKFTVITHECNEVVFTTQPDSLRQMRLIKERDRVIDVSAISDAVHLDMGLLWNNILEQRNMRHVSPPWSAHWYVVVHEAGARAAGMRIMRSRKKWSISRLFAPRRSRS